MFPRSPLEDNRQPRSVKGSRCRCKHRASRRAFLLLPYRIGFDDDIQRRSIGGREYVPKKKPKTVKQLEQGAAAKHAVSKKRRSFVNSEMHL